jgi:hypothetical protein
MPAEVVGTADVLAQLAKLRDLVKQAKEPHKQAALLIRDEARSRAPVRSGALKKSARVAVGRQGGKVLVGTAKLPYARPVHFGDPIREQGGFTLPNPFLYEAADVRIDDVFERYIKYIDKKTKELGLR